eukprot:1126115-Pelagomonas_calceolata.AAC.5
MASNKISHLPAWKHTLPNTAIEAAAFGHFALMLSLAHIELSCVRQCQSARPWQHSGAAVLQPLPAKLARLMPAGAMSAQARVAMDLEWPTVTADSMTNQERVRETLGREHSLDGVRAASGCTAETPQLNQPLVGALEPLCAAGTTSCPSY